MSDTTNVTTTRAVGEAPAAMTAASGMSAPAANDSAE